MTRTWLLGLLRQRPLRIWGTALGVALTVAFLASLGAFITSNPMDLTNDLFARYTLLEKPINQKSPSPFRVEIRQLEKTIKTPTGEIVMLDGVVCVYKNMYPYIHSRVTPLIYLLSLSLVWTCLFI